MGHLETALKLIATKGLGCRRILKIASNLEQIEDVYRLSLEELESTCKIDREIKNILKKGYDSKFVDDTLEILSKSHFNLLTIFDAEYPELLKKIYDPPIVLFMNGNSIPEDHDSIAVVGTRTPTNYGKTATEEIVRELVRNKITVVSGMARGIDTCAHESALKYGGRTIAVLGCGIDIVYPPENRPLKNNIIRNGFCCSEFPFGTRPNAVNFPRRNRIISGMSLGTIVMEAGKKSGAVLTAYNANDQNREVFAVPGRINDKNSYGTNHLIQKGAKLVTDIDSILEEIENRRRYYHQEKQLKLDLNLTKNEKQIVDLLEDTMHVDDIAEKLNKNISEVLSTLLTMELKGLIRQFPGKIFGKME